MGRARTEAREKIAAGNLKVTPQRVAILETLIKMNNHPTADLLYAKLNKKEPNISLGTVYKTLETLAQEGIINKVKSDTGSLRYDAITDRHHHIFCSDTNNITDYFDGELDVLLSDYFRNKNIPGLNIEDVKLHIIGTFSDNQQC
jgi:Fur family peroxide stress response transcriptional regulator